MRPIRFACEQVSQMPPEAIAERILELARWPEFQGYGLLPGIRRAEFETRTPQVIGSRIRVTNTDGSNHVEEIVAWEPHRHVRLRMGEFSRPLSRLAVEFIETWDFMEGAQGTRIVRSFELFPRSGLTRLPLWMISVLLKRAVARHLRQISVSNHG